MRFKDFVLKLEKAGWRATYDTQHKQIKIMWSELFPVIAQLEQELLDTEEAYKRHIEVYGRS